MKFLKRLTEVFSIGETISTTGERRTDNVLFYNVSENAIDIKLNITLVPGVDIIFTIQVKVCYLVIGLFDLTFVIVIRVLDKEEPSKTLVFDKTIDCL